MHRRWNGVWVISVNTQLARVDLYKRSGHWDHFKDSMYPPMAFDSKEG
jgi:threonyl-tRNA synthetase